MTIIHKGIRRKTTDVLDDYGQACYAQNWRFKRMGEIGRRPGLGKSNMAQLAGPVQAMICGNLYFPYLVQVTGGNVTATLDPLARWTDPVMDIPDGEVGQPAPPTIDSITPNPTSPPATYIIGVVTFTATVTYDGLSGPLAYSWSTPTDGVNSAVVVTDNANPAVFNFDATCTPGNYAYLLTVTPTGNPALAVNFPTSYTVL